jgi:D-threo-aldose 1-dehydrogenase
MIKLTALSFGAAGLGNLFRPVTDEDAAETLAAAWDAGIRSFDTAPHYGLGLSERRIGAALRDRPRDEYVLSTKVGRLLEPTPDAGGDDLANAYAVPATHRRVWDFSADGVRRSIEESLVRLGLDRVDIAYLHDPDDHEDEAFGQAYPALEQLRSEGVVRAIGAGMNQSRMLARFARETDVDVLLLAGRYTLLDQDGARELLPEAEARGVSVVIGGVFNSGLLADPKPGATYDYEAAPMEMYDKTLRIKAVCEGHGVPLRAAALAYPQRHPAVASVLLGARSPAEIEDSVAMASVPIPEELWDDLRAAGLLPASGEEVA